MGKGRRLFCELSPVCYRLSVFKCRALRRLRDLPHCAGAGGRFARRRRAEPLPVCICAHRSLIRRRLGEVDPALQENKAVNLELAARRVNGTVIRPGEIFSFWRLVGNCTKRRGYLEGLVISNGRTGRGIGGGLCQFTNLIHWMTLHTPLEITEHHHHDAYDLFPDFGRQVPFGVGTSVKYNYLDYRFRNNTGCAWQLLVRVEGEYLCGELRSERPLAVKYHLRVEDECFTQENGAWYRSNRIVRDCVDKRTGALLASGLVKENRALLLYDASLIPPGARRVSAGECVCRRDG